MISKKEVLQNLRTLRKSKEIRQEDIAPKLGLDRSTYVRKENGAIPISTDEWLKLAEVLEINPSYFFVSHPR